MFLVKNDELIPEVSFEIKHAFSFADRRIEKFKYSFGELDKSFYTDSSKTENESRADWHPEGNFTHISPLDTMTTMKRKPLKYLRQCSLDNW